jgi:site-specific recombinase XerD
MTAHGDYTVRRSAPAGDGWQLVGPDGAPVVDANRFLRAVGRRGLSSHSLRAYVYDLLCVFRWMHGTGRCPTGLCAEDLLDFIEYQRRPPSAASATINRRLSVLQRFILFLPCAPPPTGTDPSAQSLVRRRGRRHAAVRVREPCRLVTPLSDKEALVFFNNLRTARDRAITLLMWADGLRSCEILNLGLGDVDFQNMNIKLLGKGRKERMMPLAATVAKALLHYLALERPARSSCRFFVVLKGPRRGQPMTYTGLHRIFRYHRATSNVLNANPHRFRHSFGANMTRCRVPLVVLAKMMGHSSPQTTLRYVQLNDQEVRQQYDAALRTLNTSGMLDDRLPPAHT